MSSQHDLSGPEFRRWARDENRRRAAQWREVFRTTDSVRLPDGRVYTRAMFEREQQLSELLECER